MSGLAGAPSKKLAATVPARCGLQGPARPEAEEVGIEPGRRSTASTPYSRRVWPPVATSSSRIEQ